MESKGTPFLNISTDQLPEVVISVPVTRRTQAEAGVGKVLPAKDQQEGPLGVMGQLYALIAVVVEYPEYFY